VKSAQPRASAAPSPGVSPNRSIAEWWLRPARSRQPAEGRGVSAARDRTLAPAAGRRQAVAPAATSEAEKASPRAPRAPSTSGYRPFLDGLRAVAILGVLVYHLNRAWLPGGYLGVDVFFVLSGYLITMLLLAEHRDKGRIDLPAFWSRRIRRLLPALLVLLVVMAVLIELGGDPLAIGAARGDLLATLFYVANWHFITSGQSYFTQFVAVSPDRHTWSLAIEEQFYLFWPIVASAVLARFHKSALAIVAATVATASALWMVVIFDPTDPSRAYYGTDSRIFEILIGALLAIAMAGRWRDRVAAAGRRLAPLALLVIALAYVGLADDNALYYHGGAVVLCLAVAVLIAGLEAGSRIDRLLSVRPMVLIGLASYGMYLWHFPVIVFTNQWLGPTSTPANALFAVAVTFAVTAVSYVIVETPIRRRGLLLGYKLTPARLARVVPVASGVVAAVIVTSTVSGVTDPNWSAGNDQQSIAVFTAPPATASLLPFVPGQTVVPGPATPSPMGGPGITLGAVGDSVMVSALAGLRAEASKRDWTFVSAAKPACPIGYEPLYALDGKRSPYDCSGVEGLHDQLIATRPSFVLWHDLQSALARKDASGRLLLPGSQGWKDSLYAEWTRVLERFLNAGIEVVVILPPLRSEQVAGCHGVASAARCLEIQNQDSVIRAATREWFASLGGRKGAYLIQVDDLLCPKGYPCPSRISGIAVRLTGYDQTHFTDAGSTWFAPRLLDRALAALDGDTSAAA
jgi:peptidoglycan/LPS O-acetylase OafA/YrhL